MRGKILLVIFLIVAVGCLGCESMGANTKKGAGLGGLLGAVAGGVIGHQGGHGVEGALIGGAVGAIGGGTIGSGIDDQQAEKSTVATPELLEHIPIMKIVEMTEQGVPSEVIIDQFKTSGSSYKLDAETIKYLEDKKVDPKVITYMVSGN